MDQNIRESNGSMTTDTRNGTSRLSLQEEIVRDWEMLSKEQQELLIPKLLRDTALGKRAIPAAGIAWRPTYSD